MFHRLLVFICVLLSWRISYVDANELKKTDIALPASYEGDSSAQDEIAEGSPYFDNSTISWIETKRRALAGDIVALGAYIDGLMGDLEAISDHNQSYVKLYLGLGESKYYGTEALHRLRFSLDLPITKRRFRFILESEDEEAENSVDQESTRSSLSEESGEDGINASFRLLFDARHWDRLSFDWGLKANLDPDIFSRARGIRSWSLSEKWSLTFSPELFWYESRGAGARSSFDFDRLVGDFYLLRLQSSVVWYERYGHRRYVQNLAFFHDINQRRALEYSFGFSADERQHHTVVSEYFAQIRYRRNLYKGWFFYQLNIGTTFPREYEYKTNPFIGIRFEILLSDDLEKVLRTRLY
ncbi:hypothetical protein A3752_00750 [Oleiphilus sp. HI0081]|nr:hypothetical protein A3752_00750 [Oleiphilus sp. HI0081]